MERCQMGTMLLMTASSSWVTQSFLGVPSSFFSPVSFISPFSTIMWIGHLT